MARATFILVALTLSGCTLFTNEYSTTQPEDAGQDYDAAPVDGRDADLRDCTPAQATSLYTLLKGPSNGCGDDLCSSWLEMCLVEDNQYLILHTDGQFVRWFDRCNLLGFGTVNGTLRCASAEGYEVSVGAQGRMTTSAPGGFAHTWSLYHRDITEYEFLQPSQGCEENECEIFSGFQLDANHRYLVRQIEKEKVRWFDTCRLVDVGTDNLDKLICAEPEEGYDIVIHTNAPETTSVQTLSGSWTVFSEPIEDTQSHVYMAPTPGCGSTTCQLWDNFELGAEYRYMVLQSDDSKIRWFDTCHGEFHNPDNKNLRCTSNDGHFIELQTQGDETSDISIDAGSNWSLLRWPLQSAI